MYNVFVCNTVGTVYNRCTRPREVYVYNLFVCNTVGTERDAQDPGKCMCIIYSCAIL